jgi:predicted CXXCH cytochrome family protein
MAEEMKLGVLHAPLESEEACTVCHSPHTSKQAPLLSRKQAKVCATCHEDNVRLLETSTHIHPEQKGEACTACHNPHMSEKGGSEVELVTESCLTCHTHREHTDHPMGAGVLDPRTSEAMMCTSCHDAHGSEYPKFLMDEPKGRLCVQCHTDMIRKAD